MSSELSSSDEIKWARNIIRAVEMRTLSVLTENEHDTPEHHQLCVDVLAELFGRSATFLDNCGCSRELEDMSDACLNKLDIENQNV